MSVLVVHSALPSLRFCRFVGDQSEPKYNRLLEEIKSVTGLGSPFQFSNRWYRPEIEAFLEKWERLGSDIEARTRFVAEHASAARSREEV